MGQRRAITGLVASVVTLLAIGVVVSQDATTAQETPLPNAQAYFDRGVASRNKVDFDSAIAEFTKAIQLDPKFARAYFARGLVYQDKGDTDRAIADFTRVIELDPLPLKIRKAGLVQLLRKPSSGIALNEHFVGHEWRRRLAVDGCREITR